MRRFAAVVVVVSIAIACGPAQLVWPGLGGCTSSADGITHENCRFNASATQDLRGMNFGSSKSRALILRDSKFSLAPMKGANLSVMILSNDTFDMVDLTDADLSEADITGSTFNYSDFSHAKLYRVKILRSTFGDVDFSFANLVEAQFFSVDFTGSSFLGANLRNAIFDQGSVIERADFSQADLTGAQFVDINSPHGQDAIYCHTTMPDGTLNNRDC